MSASGASRPPEVPVVQQLLAERRELKVAAERLRLELSELNGRIGGPDPRLRALETENSRLREELAAARVERDTYRQAVVEAVGKLEMEMKRAPH